MAHRDDRDALRAKNEALERELAEAREELARSRAAGETASRTARTDRLAAIVARVSAWIGAAAAPFSPRDALARWGLARSIAFAALAYVLIAGSAAGFLAFATIFDGPVPDQGPIAIALWSSIAWVFLGPGLVSWIAARVLRAPASASGAALAVALSAIAIAIAPGFVPLLRDAPRALIGGDASGTIEEVRARPHVAWARLEPAYVLHTAIGTGVSSRIEDGHTVSSSRSCAPIVPSIPWSGSVALFACGDREDLAAAGPGDGSIEGRIAPLEGLEHDAVRSLEGDGIAIDPSPRAVTATLGGAAATFTLGALALFLVLGLGSLGCALLALRIATVR